MSSKSVAQRSSPTKRTDSRQRSHPIQRQAMGGGSPNPAEMQKRLGNQGTQAWLAEQQIQPKLTIGQPGDQHEQEADRTADAVMRMPDPGPPGDEETKNQAKLQPNELRLKSDVRVTTTEVPLMAKSESGQLQASSDLQQKLNNSKGSGRTLPKDTRSSLESAMGADFSNVNIHTGTDAVEMNKELGAQAFTHGSDIYFNQGKYDPTSSSGKHLLAHELTHTVQQGGSSLHPKTQSGELESGSLKTDAPNIQAFAIPFTDYETDFSIEGVKNAANIAKDTVVDSAEGIKDKIEGGMQWVFDEISGLVSSGITWLSEKWSSIQSIASSGFEALKNSFTSIIGLILSPFSFIANAIISMDAESLSAAWTSFNVVVSSAWEGFKNYIGNFLQQVTDIWEGISGYATSLLDKISSLTQNYLFKKLPDTLQEIVYSLINQIKSLWNNISERWNTLFNDIKTWIDSALNTIEKFALQVTSFAINVIIDGIRQFGELVLFLQDLFTNPQKYLEILAAKGVEALSGVESFFSSVVNQYFGEDKKTKPANAISGTIQKQPETGTSTEVKDSASWGQIGSGVWEMMGKKWNEFKSNPLSILSGLLIDLFIPMYGNVKDVIQLYDDIKKIVTGPLSAGSLEEFWTSLLQILDIPILINHTVISILMRTLMLPLIVASFIPHPLVKGIAATVGFSLLGAFVAAESLNVGHKLLLLKTGATTKAQKEEAYNRIADSFIAYAMTAAIMLIMLFLHFMANVIKGVYNFVKGKIFPVERIPIEGKGSSPAEGKGKGAPEEGKAAEAKNAKELPSEDGKRKVKINEEGKCEVCASPCDDIRKKYTSQMTPEIEGKIKAIESDATLSDAQKIEELKPIEQKLANLQNSIKGPYSNIKDGTKVEPGRPFQPNQKPKILEANRNNNGGKLRSDNPNDPWFGKDLVEPPKGPFEPGKFPEVPKNQAQVDHKTPRIGPDGQPLGTNAYSNAEVISAEFNNMKRNKL